ncbi:MarR family winged helix-turn-helix transcriptional regulator [Clostridium massiliamazoniense]|uniref:MarR family winged helix-turn-helix transcriptional regulator n=1 Tax=Clostridium massiliamazoniense TaxID=1347366 RepID=UPI0006D79A57|nr:MarR family transcriptional regulator [Clostridium massiliamazoniense]
MNNIDLNNGLTEGFSPGRLISIVSRYHSYCLGKSLSKYDLSKCEYRCLIQIYKHEGICQDDIADILKIDKFRIAKSIKLLMEKGYVYKEKDIKDKRKHKVYPTENALSIKEAFIDILNYNSNIMVKGFSEEEKRMVNSLLVKMAENLYEEAEKVKNIYK